MGAIFNPILGVVDFNVINMPFVVRIWFIFMICIVVGVIVSLLTKPPHPDQPVDLSGIDFTTTTGFKIMAALVVTILAGLYFVFW